MDLKNKVVVITGASSGVGKATAIKFAKKKAKLVLVARRLKKLKEIEEKLASITDIISVKADVANSSDVNGLFELVKNKYGRLDFLINNAGRGLPAKLLDINEEEWDSVHDVNCKGVFLCTKEAVKLMLEKGVKGHIITVSSIAGLYGAPGYSAYCSSKHAVTGFKRSIRFELWKEGIKISTIHPGRIDTEFFSDYVAKPTKKQMLSSFDIADYIVAIASRNYFSQYYIKIRNVFKRLFNLIN